MGLAYRINLLAQALSPPVTASLSRPGSNARGESIIIPGLRTGAGQAYMYFVTEQNWHVSIYGSPVEGITHVNIPDVTDLWLKSHIEIYAVNNADAV